MSWAEPDDVRDYYPQGTCECGAELARAADLGVARSFQQTEIPGPSAQRIQHDLQSRRWGAFLAVRPSVVRTRLRCGHRLGRFRPPR